MRGVEAAVVEIGFAGDPPAVDDVQTALVGVSGAESARFRDRQGAHLVFEVEGAPNHTQLRPALAAAIVQRGWHLYEMKSVSYSLEDVFLQVTQGESLMDAAESSEAATTG